MMRDELDTLADLDAAAERARERRHAAILADLETMPATDWYMADGSRCDACGHGPRWHNDPSGCTRQLEGWCDCERVYLPGAGGPEDFTAE